VRIEPTPPDPTPKHPDAGAAAPPGPRLPLAQVADPAVDTALSAALAPADPVHIHPLDLMGAMQIVIAEVRADLAPPGAALSPPGAAPHGGGPRLEPLLLATGGVPDEPMAALTPQTVVQMFLQAVPPPEMLEPQVWLAAATELEGRVQVALDRAVAATTAWRDVPAAVVEGVTDTRAVVVAALGDDPPNPLWLRPEWLGLAPRMERYWRRRRRARRWLRDPDLHWRERDEDREPSGREQG
jgi:hypothetical protein